MDNSTLIFLWLFLSVVVGFIGKDREITFGGAVILSLLLSPLVGYAICMSSKRVDDKKSSLDEVAARAFDIDLNKDEIKNEKIENYSVVDEIKKWHDLKVAGAITEAEFEEKKKELIKN